MHRYRDDSVITYSADDLVLFLESPFAAWMERLTLEHPDHGIPPDPGSRPPENSASPQHAFSATLRVSGRDFVRVDWEQPEPQRVAATLEAMRGGADFIVDGQLAAGVLSGPANLLMRTGGFSDFGDYLYLPCATGCEYDHRAAFRLCFLADLLLAVQGQLPPKLLQVRDESDLSALATGSHIHYYRAVKERFLRAQREFRRDRMPDPAESSHCGRWHDCANEVIRQRLQRRPADGAPSTAPRAPAPEAGAPSSSPNPPWWRHYVEPVDRGGVKPAPRTGEGATLAEQARELAIEMGAAERGAVERVEERGKVGGEARGEVRGEEGAEVEAGGGPDDSPRLQLLRFIGESDGPSPLLWESGEGDYRAPVGAGEFVPPPPGAAGELWELNAPAPGEGPAPHPLDSPGFNISAHIRRPGGRRDPAGEGRNGALSTADDAVPLSERLNTRDGYEG